MMRKKRYGSPLHRALGSSQSESQIHEGKQDHAIPSAVLYIVFGLQAGTSYLPSSFMLHLICFLFRHKHVSWADWRAPHRIPWNTFMQFWFERPSLSTFSLTAGGQASSQGSSCR